MKTEKKFLTLATILLLITSHFERSEEPPVRRKKINI